MSDARTLYDALIDAWNRRNADQYAELFEDDGAIVGFDGSEVVGREEIRAHLAAIFKDHPTASYIAKVREVRDFGEVAMLRAVAGMIPPGGGDLMPERHAVQTLVARERIVLFQNTPAQFDGRPEAVEALTEELQNEVAR